MIAPQSKLAVTNGRLVLADKIVEGKSVLIEDGKISAIAAREEYNTEDFDTIDAAGTFVTPGLVDIHIHGCLHFTFNDPKPEAFEVILRKTLSCGVTTLLPTLVSAPIDELCETLAFIEKWRSSQKIGMTQVHGTYLESPYIAPAAAGAQPASTIRTPDDGSIDKLLDFSSVISVFMLAPELSGGIEAVRKIDAHGIIPAMGHTMAIEREILPAIDAGASHVTHLWSAMSGVVRHGPWRQPGLVEVTLVNPALTTEIIADNKHLPPTLMKLAILSKKDQLCAVSDALNGAGLPEGSKFRVGDQTYEVADGVGMVADRSSFAGSTTLLNQEIPVLVRETGLSIPEAVRMVTEIPARIIKAEDKIGSIRPGLDADLVLFRDDFTAVQVIQKGQLVTI